MNEQVHAAMRHIVKPPPDEEGDYCGWCGEDMPGPHTAGCPVGVIEKYLAALDAPKGETVRVRIAVAIAPSGGWSATGDGEWSDQEAMLMAAEGTVVRFVECDIPLPKPAEPVTVEGTVVEP